MSAAMLGGSVASADELSEATATCAAQDVRGTTPSGTLLATEFSFARARSPCPTARIDITKPVVVPRGRPMWLWFRLEGDLTYLATRQSQQEIFLVVGYGPDQAVLDDFISLKSINHSAAQMEAEIPRNNGHFDWRVDGYKSAFFVPGTYYFELAQGPARICFLTGDQETCRLKVTVK